MGGVNKQESAINVDENYFDRYKNPEYIPDEKSNNIIGK
jgi:hypothetical protein